MTTTGEKREAARPVLVRDWMDLYVFDQPAEIVCPDCDEVSPEVGNVFAAAKWAEEHTAMCPGFGAVTSRDREYVAPPEAAATTGETK